MNLYPMKVSRTDGGIVRNCRLVSEAGVTQVWAWPPEAEQPHVVAEVAARPDRIGTSGSYRVGTVRVDPQRGCGCGHRMHGWVPPRSDPG